MKRLMDVREKLVELLQDENNPVWRWFQNNMAMMQLADYLISNGVTVQEWVSVKDRLPEIGQKCLIANREIVVRGWLRPDGVWKTGVSSDEIWSKFSLYPPTHWMPLPEPPKGE